MGFGAAVVLIFDLDGALPALDTIELDGLRDAVRPYAGRGFGELSCRFHGALRFVVGAAGGMMPRVDETTSDAIRSSARETSGGKQCSKFEEKFQINLRTLEILVQSLLVFWIRLGIALLYT